MDAAVTYNGLSLNETIYQRQKLQNNLFDVLLRLRKNKIALSCHISEMFLQIEIAEEHSRYHRFLWRELESNVPTIFEFMRVVFGINSLPFLSKNAKL